MKKSPYAKQDCECCAGTGWCGDNGPGISGNREYHHCDCVKQPGPLEASTLDLYIEKVRKLQAELVTEHAERKAAEFYIAVIPALCRGEIVPCAMHVSEPIYRLRAEVERLEKDLEKSCEETRQAWIVINQLTGKKTMTGSADACWRIWCRAGR